MTDEKPFPEKDNSQPPSGASEDSNHSNQSDGSVRSDKSDRSDLSDKPDQSDRSGRPAFPPARPAPSTFAASAASLDWPHSPVSQSLYPLYGKPMSKGVNVFQPPPRLRELAALLGTVILGDLALYSGGGFAGFAAFFLLMPGLFYLGVPRHRAIRHAWILLALLVVLALRLLWLGTPATAVAGVLLLVGFALALAGLPPHILEGFTLAIASLFGGIARLIFYSRNTRKTTRQVTKASLAWIVPAAALAIFGGIFILANPAVRDAVGEWFDRAFRDLFSWIPRPGHILFWGVLLWATAGLLRPTVDRILVRKLKHTRETVDRSRLGETPAWFYPVARNTLGALIALFAAYLVFELATLWRGEFPEGFYYSGYAHEGAAWLTVALALATLTLGVVFQGRLLVHPHLSRLKRLAWIWSSENLVLAICVFHRMQIYVDYNGMSRMRVVGLFGIGAVVAGFALVVWKVATRKNFLWIVRRQLWVLAAAVVLYLLFPVDLYVTRYNVHEIRAGNPAPSVQITSHPVNPEGLPALLPLLNHPDDTIRTGIQALLARHAGPFQAEQKYAREKGWSHLQLARLRAFHHLETTRSQWDVFETPNDRDAAWTAFVNRARRWYD